MRFKPRFSLRTLFVLITIARCWIGCQLNWIRERHRFLREHHEQIISFEETRFPNGGQLPWSLRLFGERGQSVILANTGEVHEAEKLFPEATLITD